MNRLVATGMAMGFVALTAPAALAGEEWKWGVNFYDLQLRNLPAEDSPVTADICSSVMTFMAVKMMDQGKTDAQAQFANVAHVWKGEGMIRRQVDAETYQTKYLLPAYALFRELRTDHMTFWASHCTSLIQKRLPVGD